MNKVYGITITAVLLASTAQSFAASVTAAAPAPAPVSFVDLTKTGGGGTSSTLPAPVAEMSTAPRAMDLTNGSATPMVQREWPGSRVARVHPVDLTSGAEPPDLNQLEDEPDTPVDTIVITADRDADPYEETNRGRFTGHVWLHRRVIDPVERTYFAVVPTPARDSLHSFLFNLETPTILLNDLFQGDISRAGDTVARFIVNTTLGLGGLIDVAGKTGMHYRDNDFGATLATYGVSDYPYLLIPVIGPSNPRDLSGKVVDFALDPLHFVTLPGGLITSIGKTGAHELDKRSVDVGELDMLARTAPDPYAAERAMARKRRAEEVSGDGK